MKRIKFLTIVYLMFFVSVAWAEAKDDWQLWGSTYIEKTLNKSWKVSLEEQSHFSGDFGRLSYYYMDAGTIYAAKDWLDLGVNYRFIRAIKNGFWENEQRPYFNATLLKRWNIVTLSNRSRIEQRMLDDTKDFLRYRNQSKMVFDLNIRKRSIRPYVSEESFFDLDQPVFDYVQVTGGIEIEITKNLYIDIHYLRQDAGGRGTEPKAHVLGVGTNFYF